MKKALSLLLSVLMLLSITVGMNFNAYATGKTADQAISWVKSQLGSTVGSGECVALISSYYSYLGVSPVSGNGCDYATNSLPSGWTRTKGGTPQKGDILVYNANSENPYGHVGIYEGDYSHYHQNVNGRYVECITGWKYNGFTNSYWGCIHPNFSGSSSIGKATNLKIRVIGGMLVLSWDAATGANCYDVIVNMPDNSVQYLHASGTSKDLRNFDYGTYKFDVQSLYRPNGSATGQTVGPHSDVLTYNFTMQSPTNVTVTPNGTTLTVTWDAADGANCYDVIMTNPSNETNWYHTDRTSMVFTNCSPGNYVFDIQSLYRPNGSTTGQVVGPHSGDFKYTLTQYEVLTGWQDIDGKKYYYENGEPLKGKQVIDGKTYIFSKATGEMLVGKQRCDGKWYILSKATGEALSGKVRCDGKWYIMSKSTYEMLYGMVRCNGKYYIMSKSTGEMLYGKVSCNGKGYIMSKSTGEMLYGKVTCNGYTYICSKSDGHIFTNQYVTCNGLRYYCNSSGVATRR